MTPSQSLKDFGYTFLITLGLTAVFGGLAGAVLTKSRSLSVLFTVFPTKTVSILIILYFFRDPQKIDRKREIMLYFNQLYKYLFLFTWLSFFVFFVLNDFEFKV